MNRPERAGRFGQVTAAVAAQIHDQRVHLLGLQLGDELLHVTRGAAIVLGAGRLGFEVLIEARHVDHADLHLAIATLDGVDFLLRRLGVQRNLVSLQLQDLFRRARRGAGGQDAEAHGGADLAANDLHHVIEAPADHIRPVCRSCLRPTRDDAIVRAERAVDRRRAAGQHVEHGDVVIDELQRGTDALVRQAHLNAVFLGVARREVARVRVEDMRERIHEHFEDVVAGDLLGALDHALVALLQDVLGLRPGLVGEHQGHGVVLHATAPDVVQFFGGLGPRRLGAVELERLIDGEVRLGLEQLHGVARRRSLLRCWKRLKIANTGSSWPFTTASSSW